jgi:RNA polymerase sigma-70 factor (ECF subfamily)
MPVSPGHYAEGPEALVVSLAARGDKDAFAELVRRRHSWVRSLMRRCCGDVTLADDLSQQVFMQAWRKIRQVKDVNRFAGWLKRLAINEWLQHVRKNDVLKGADDDKRLPKARPATTSLAMDLDGAMATLPGDVSLCITLAYHERMTHAEITGLTGIPSGTVKSHIRRGSKRLKKILSAYNESGQMENES